MATTAAKSRLSLHHGTSTARLQSILKERRLRIAKSGDPYVSMTTEKPVAQYFACGAAFGDQHDRPGEPAKPVVLVLDGERLLAFGYKLFSTSSPVWGDGACDWENEISCASDIEPMDDVLLDVEQVSDERVRDWHERGPSAFMSLKWHVASVMLAVTKVIVQELKKGRVTPQRADAVVRGLQSAIAQSSGSSGLDAERVCRVPQ
jgi:hypothetical protein